MYTLLSSACQLRRDAHCILQRDVELLVPGDLHCLLWVLIVVSNPLGALIAIAGVSVL